jgi:hypothetical protein
MPPAGQTGLTGFYRIFGSAENLFSAFYRGFEVACGADRIGAFKLLGWVGAWEMESKT